MCICRCEEHSDEAIQRLNNPGLPRSARNDGKNKEGIQMKIGIIGCGLIGTKRAAAAKNLGLEIVAASDINVLKAKALTDKFGGRPSANNNDVINSAAEIIVIAAYHKSLPEIAKAALNAGKHLLLEKPGARRPAELLELIKLSKEKNLKVKVGFNHRFHPALLKAREIVDSGALGELYYVRGWYGHGGRVGYNKEWRFTKDISGGGELLDQGSHLIDLSLWFLGDFSSVKGALQNYFWGGEVEDNCFMILQTKEGKCAALHATWTEWKNAFKFEITGKNGKIEISGFGGSYGTETVTFYKMLPQMGPPETTSWQYPFADKSWDAEFTELLNAIKQDRQPMGGLEDCFKTLTVVEKLYNGQTEKI